MVTHPLTISASTAQNVIRIVINVIRVSVKAVYKATMPTKMGDV